MTVRTRFAPSPTGYQHVGGIRTAIFGWLLARQNNGKFVLRLEDTDQKRLVAGADKHLENSLKALGLIYDEGPDIGGPYAPYRQSERLETYKKWAQQLVEKGRAYADPYTTDEVDAFRQQAQQAKKPYLYRNHRPDNPPEWDGSQPLRLLSKPQKYIWHDEVMGDIETGPEVIDDFILIKADGFPTYNFAHIVDDAEMKISHVIRGQEFLSSMPNYLNLYDALEIERPLLATVPHILGPAGDKKLSKRDGAKDVLDYIRDGFLSEALVNFIVSLGWNDGTEQEIFTRDQLVRKFSLDRIQRSGARFDEQRLLWMNGYYIRETPLDELYRLSMPFWPPASDKLADERKKKVLALVQERLKYLAELPSLTNFFFEDLPVKLALIDGNKQLKKFSHEELSQMLNKSRTSLADSDFSAEDLTDRLNGLLRATNQKPGVLFSLIRIATTWAPASPGLAETLELLGKETTLRRINTSQNALG